MLERTTTIHRATLGRKREELNIEDYQRLLRHSDHRMSGTIDTMSDALFSEFESAVDSYAQDDDGSRS
ncbi:hypothetical protein [Mesorhizobium sp.]|uniref:hypothetical protein n=1 Tax=Mesorhizobium sp. TaxID=1871066 RepID=UPI00257B7D75|nr:hypothetical protein [Mesorhizobium sp.]